ncbi:MAG TPA: triose-phosphate isomerase [Candidatus Paceibacterota bacterium]
MNKILIVANWKMNPKTGAEAQELFDAIGKGVSEIDGAEVVICPPFIYLSQLETKNYELKTGAQNCFWENQGAFTGEVSPTMLKNLGCSYVILGHSERKSNLGETLEMVSKKVRAALAAGLIPVVCIGEKFEQEMSAVLKDITLGQTSKLILVYEPEWAISTNKGATAATPEDCGQAIESMRKIAKKMFGAIQIPILYGGSTNSKNIRGFIESGAQGALVGSASLDAQEFIQLVKNAVTG